MSICGYDNKYLRIRKWSTFDPGSSTVKLHEKAEPCDQDLLDFAAAYTLIHRGTVYTVKPEDVPDGLPLGLPFSAMKDTTPSLSTKQAQSITDWTLRDNIAVKGGL